MMSRRVEVVHPLIRPTDAEDGHMVAAMGVEIATKPSRDEEQIPLTRLRAVLQRQAQAALP